MTALSTRLSAATSMMPELREELARMCGWVNEGYSWAAGTDIWTGDDATVIGCPTLDLTQIVDEIRRKGWFPMIDIKPWGVTVLVLDADMGQVARSERPDRNIQLAAATALALALEGEK